MNKLKQNQVGTHTLWSWTGNVEPSAGKKSIDSRVCVCVCVLAGFHGLQETARQDADVTQESAPAGVQLLERAGASRGAQHLWAPLLPAQGEEHTTVFSVFQAAVLRFLKNVKNIFALYGK